MAIGRRMALILALVSRIGSKRTFYAECTRSFRKTGITMQFTAHNIRLDDGSYTKPDHPFKMEDEPWLISAQSVLNTVFPGDKSQYRIADLGCLEGGYAVEFARMGFQTVGVEVRAANIEACHHVKSRTKLDNLSFVQDDVNNIAAHGRFDAIFCCGLFYHLDKPKSFLHTLSSVCNKLLILQTHFSLENGQQQKFGLSPLMEHEGIRGRWFNEFPDETSFNNREERKWASWDNRQSFWIQKEHLLQEISNAGFSMVAEQFDGMGSDIKDSLLTGYYKNNDRGTFIGIKA